MDDRKYYYGLCTPVSGNTIEDTQSGIGGLTMDDYISREAAIEAALDYSVDVIENDYDRGYQKAVKDIAKELNSIPAADVRPVVRGEWKPHLTNRCRDVCSVCGVSTLRRTYGINPDGTEWVDEASYPFCPWCAADMRGGV